MVSLGYGRVLNVASIWAFTPASPQLSAAQVARLGFDAMLRRDARIVTGATTNLKPALLPCLTDSWALKLLEQGAPD